MNNTQTDKATQLQAKLVSREFLQAHTKELVEFETEHLKQFIGLSVFKVDGSYKAKYSHEQKSIAIEVERFGFKWWVDSHYWLEVAYKKVSIKVKTCITGGGADRNGFNAHCIYDTMYLDLFLYTENETLGDVVCNDREYLSEPLPTVESVLKQVEAIEAAKKAYSAEVDKLPYYLRDVFYIKNL